MKTKTTSHQKKLQWLGGKENTRCWNMSNHLTAAAKLSSNNDSQCAKKFKSVLEECVHVVNSRLQHEFKRGGSTEFMTDELHHLGCLCKELTVPPAPNNLNREQHKVMDVMTCENN